MEGQIDSCSSRLKVACVLAAAAAAVAEQLLLLFHPAELPSDHRLRLLLPGWLEGSVGRWMGWLLGRLIRKSSQPPFSLSPLPTLNLLRPNYSVCAGQP